MENNHQGEEDYRDRGQEILDSVNEALDVIRDIATMLFRWQAASRLAQYPGQDTSPWQRQSMLGAFGTPPSSPRLAAQLATLHQDPAWPGDQENLRVDTEMGPDKSDPDVTSGSEAAFPTVPTVCYVPTSPTQAQQSTSLANHSTPLVLAGENLAYTTNAISANVASRATLVTEAGGAMLATAQPPHSPSLVSSSPLASSLRQSTAPIPGLPDSSSRPDSTHPSLLPTHELPTEERRPNDGPPEATTTSLPGDASPPTGRSVDWDEFFQGGRAPRKHPVFYYEFKPDAATQFPNGYYYLECQHPQHRGHFGINPMSGALSHSTPENHPELGPERSRDQMIMSFGVLVRGCDQPNAVLNNRLFLDDVAERINFASRRHFATARSLQQRKRRALSEDKDTPAKQSKINLDDLPARGTSEQPPARNNLPDHASFWSTILTDEPATLDSAPAADVKPSSFQSSDALDEKKRG